MSNYLLLDVNGTVGTDERPLLEYLENPEDFVWIDKVLAHIRLSTLERIKTISETYNVTVLWASLRADDALCLNQLIDVSWGWLDVNSIVDRSNEGLKLLGLLNFTMSILVHLLLFVMICCALDKLTTNLKAKQKILKQLSLLLL